MGIVNVTPDSFSDGGVHFDSEGALHAARQMIRDGADLLDLGAESSRPGSDPVPAAEEIARLDGVLQQIIDLGAPVSIDTMKPEVADWCLERGAHMINDITGLGSEMLDVVRRHGAPCVVMHMAGRPKTMQAAPRYQDVTAEVRGFLEERVDRARAAGVQTLIDPGFGFGKTLEHNLELLRHLDAFSDLGPLLIGISRKSMLGALTGARVSDRLAASLAAAAVALDRGAAILRVHDVAAHRQLLQVRGAVRGVGVEAATDAQIRLDGIEAALHLGVPDQEREKPQTIAVDLELRVHATRAAASDEIADAADYAALPDLVRTVCGERPVKLLENLAQRLADAVLAQSPAREVLVRIHKPGAANELDIDRVRYQTAVRRAGADTPVARAAIALGANLGDRTAQLDAAVSELRRLGVIEAISDWIETEPEHGVDHPRYLNGAVILRTTLRPADLLDELQSIERRFGRQRPAQDQAPAPRTLDLDLLLVDDRVIDTPDLVLPHPRMAQRTFVLDPLATIAPDLRHPVLGRTIRELRRAIGDSDDSASAPPSPAEPVH